MGASDEDLWNVWNVLMGSEMVNNGLGSVWIELKRKELTSGVAEDVYGPVVHLAEGLDLQVVAVDPVVPLPLDVGLQVLGHVLPEVVGVGGDVVHAVLADDVVHLLVAVNL